MGIVQSAGAQEPTGMASKGIASRTKAARRPRFLTSLSMSPRMSLWCTSRHDSTVGVSRSLYGSVQQRIG